MTRPHRASAEVLAESDAGWRLIRGDKRCVPQPILLLSADYVTITAVGGIIFGHTCCEAYDTFPMGELLLRIIY